MRREHSDLGEQGSFTLESRLLVGDSLGRDSLVVDRKLDRLVGLQHSASALIEAADAGAYRAKQAGRNCVAVAPIDYRRSA